MWTNVRNLTAAATIPVSNMVPGTGASATPTTTLTRMATPAKVGQNGELEVSLFCCCIQEAIVNRKLSILLVVNCGKSSAKTV